MNPTPHPQPHREHYSRLWGEVYALLQTHLKAKEGAVQACLDTSRLGGRAEVDHLAGNLLQQVKDARGNLTEEMVRSPLAASALLP